jgi:hypothetical protein
MIKITKTRKCVQWARLVHKELVPHNGIALLKAIEADFMTISGVLALDRRATLVAYPLRRWAVDCSTGHKLAPKKHHLWLGNPQTLYGVESATLAPGYGDPAAQDIKMEITYEQT